MIVAPHNQKAVGQFIDLGFQFAISIGLGVGLGYYLDTKFHTSPLLLVFGLLLGATSGFLNIYRSVYPSNKSKKENDKK